MFNELFSRGPSYVFVSLACLLFNNALLISLDASGLHYGLAVLVSAAVMIPLGYYLQARVTFNAPLSWFGMRRYAAIIWVNIPGMYVLLWLVHDSEGIAMLYAAPIVTSLMFIWNYLASSWAILPHLTQK